MTTAIATMSPRGQALSRTFAAAFEALKEHAKARPWRFQRDESLPDAVQLSELAATILQGFPEHWQFAGATKKARWSQIGQAMPPPLAEAVARAVVEQDEATNHGGIL